MKILYICLFGFTMNTIFIFFDFINIYITLIINIGLMSFLLIVIFKAAPEIDPKKILILFLCSIIVIIGQCIALSRYSDQEQLKAQFKAQQQEKIPTQEIKIINKVVWNDVEVSYDDEMARGIIKNLFKSQFEKYNNKLKKMDIKMKDNENYWIILHFDDGSTQEKIIEKYINK